MTRQFRQPFAPIYHKPLDIDARGFVLVNGVKVARYFAETGTLEFIDHSRRSNKQLVAGSEKAQVVEVKAQEFIRLLESVRNGTNEV